ncbi:aminodeoxychorismate synthase component I [Tepidicaulis sp. LMO-SS28]|uniref:aminodeoxychorismate synthase component I n=1 Tax=Tepidicaulis sp. LMO-SS28 TaxID=3447455 RepID=UPI003EE3DE7B
MAANFTKIVTEEGLIFEELPFSDPLALFAPLAHEPFALFLDSATAGPGKDERLHGRWSVIAADPVTTLTVAPDGRMEMDGSALEEAPFPLIKRLLTRHEITRKTIPAPFAHLPFIGGLAGFFGYEMGHALERLPKAKDKDGFPRLALGLYDTALLFDHKKTRAVLVSTGLGEKTPAARAARAEARAAKWRARLKLSPALPPLIWPLSAKPGHAVHALKDKAAHMADVQKVIDYIYAGDIFQANLAQRFESDLTPDEDALLIYRRLRAHSPAPFAGFFNFGKAALLSSSPERFLHVDGETIETKPIKGTRPRGRTAKEDAALAEELLASGKDRAENVMIVDLLRNDLSRVSRDHSVKAEKLCTLESYANVHHLVSTVTGRLRGGETAVDALAACFPGGSIIGAPKIRAMEIITELEPFARGPYCGALGFLGLDGRMDTNILIRTMTVRGNKAVFHAGGGIVADSDPEAEYEETIAKASAMRAACLGTQPEAQREKTPRRKKPGA